MMISCDNKPISTTISVRNKSDGSLTPGWVTEVNLFVSIIPVEPRQKQGSKMVSTGPGNGLGADNAFLLDGGTVSSKN